MSTTKRSVTHPLMVELMERASALFRAAREFLLQHEAEKRARALEPTTAHFVEESVRAADKRMELLGDVSKPAVALASVATLREVAELLFAAESSIAPQNDASQSDQLHRVGGVLGVPSIVCDRASQLLTDEPIAFDRTLSSELVESARALEEIVRRLRRYLDGRSGARIVWSRWTRIAVATLLGTYFVVTLARWLVTPPNVAHGKPVTLSSLDPRSAPPASLVDGVRSAESLPGAAHPDVVLTRAEEKSWALIDLQGSINVREIRIYNRDDVAPLTMGGTTFEDPPPLTIELSRDASGFWTVGQCTTHFGSWWGDPPCRVTVDQQTARYVRVLATNGAIALSEIEVLAW